MKVILEQFHGGNGRGRAAAHTVIQRDHLWHVGHGDLFARPEGGDTTDKDGGRHQQVIFHPRIEEGDQGGYQHADTGPDNAITRCDR